ncbi:hypothetical protein JTE90_028440 [Oedothorax gibbosus]|uniref:Uncharacterized protein n=1 Tax=Oedothorax gibbosus TaxID=931172 RepID=A0AAV6VGT9_9ARAC|nr:hypothetical protein JTE90_028440 [Oedothorax gibbosus]
MTVHSFLFPQLAFHFVHRAKRKFRRADGTVAQWVQQVFVNPLLWHSTRGRASKPFHSTIMAKGGGLLGLWA